MNPLFNILFLIIISSLPFIALRYVNDSIEKRAKKSIGLLPANLLAKFEDAKIWFKGYDMMKRTDSVNPPFRKKYCSSIH